jgi:hypothetical protein
MNKLLSCFAVLLTVVLVTGAASEQGLLKVGDKAPDFPVALASSAGDKPGGATIQLSDYIGKKNIVLAFYVADWTGG